MIRLDYDDDYYELMMTVLKDKKFADGESGFVDSETNWDNQRRVEVETHEEKIQMFVFKCKYVNTKIVKYKGENKCKIRCKRKNQILMQIQR